MSYCFKMYVIMALPDFFFLNMRELPYILEKVNRVVFCGFPLTSLRFFFLSQKSFPSRQTTKKLGIPASPLPYIWGENKQIYSIPKSNNQCEKITSDSNYRTDSLIYAKFPMS